MPAIAVSSRAAAPVTIVGGGPVGMALAFDLARQGVASIVLEADKAVCDGSRAICLSRRTLEILDRDGTLQVFMAKGLPWTSGRSFHEDTLMYRFTMPHAGTLLATRAVKNAEARRLSLRQVCLPSVLPVM